MKRGKGSCVMCNQNIVRVSVMLLLTSLLVGCGTCPDLSYGGRLNSEDLVFVQKRMSEKGLNEAKPPWFPRCLARRLVMVPLVCHNDRAILFRGRPETVSRDASTRSTFGDLEPIRTYREGGAYNYYDLESYAFPLYVWLDYEDRWFVPTGEETGCVEYKGLIGGFLGSWGAFEFEGRNRVPAKLKGTGIFLGLGLPSIAPSRWYFTGTEGRYWSAPLWLFGHVSSDTSGTFWLLHGLIPIRYSNSEKPGNL